MKIKKMLSAVISGLLLLSPAVTGGFKAYDSYGAGTRVSVHDPSIFKDDNGTYYVFGSHIDSAKSPDLQNWTRFSNGYATKNNVLFGDLSSNLSKAFAWAGENLEDCEGGFSVWAPDVIYNPDYINKDGSKGAYMMYFCTTSTYMRSVLAFGVSQKAEGPYEFVDTLIYSGFTSNDSYATSSTKNVNRKYTSTNVDELIASGEVTYNKEWFNGTNFNNRIFPNAIDSTIYYDTQGRMYMTYGSWSGGIFTIEIDKATGKCIHPKTGKTADGRMVDSYFGTKISGGYGKSGEGPFMEYNPETGYYYLWVTYGGLTATGGYNMRVFRSTSPTGPFVDPFGKPAVLNSDTNLDSVGLKVMGNYQFSSLDTAYMAGGHNSVLRDDDGKWYLIYHTRFNRSNEYHEVRVHSMYFNNEGWPVVAPFEYSGDVISEYGYESADITGDYEYINHGTATNGNVIKYQNISLNSDGTISGAVKGTWSQAEDSSQATLNISGQIYNGHFLAAQDETGKKVMSFTAVGSNNQTIWGAKTKAFTGENRVPIIDYTNAESKLVYNADSVSGTGAYVKIGDTSLLSGISYNIANKFSGKVLDLAEGKTENGANIQQWTKTGGSHQEWRIIAENDGYCRIASMADESMCIAVDGNNADDGLNVELQKFSGSDNQLYKIVKSGLYYGIVSKSSGDKAGLDVYDWSEENGGNINQWEYWEGDCQLWSITPVYPSVPSGNYTIRNLNSGLYIAENSGNAVQSKSEIWTFTQQNDGTYTIQNSDGKALTVADSSAEDGANIMLADLNNSKSQKFKLQCNKDGTYALLTMASDGLSCADVFEISLDDGANICQWEFWNGDGQKFILEPAVKAEKKIVGDVNADGEFSVADLVMLEKYLLNAGTLTDWTKGDLCKDEIIDVFDLIEMRKLIVK